MDYIINLQNIVKNFGGVYALKGVNFSVKPGEIHALIGENGAGKSTMMNILSGVFPPTSGEYMYEGKTVRFSNPMEARNMGISMVHQELSLAPALSVAENIHAGRLIANKFGITNRHAMNVHSQELLDTLNIKGIQPTDTIRDLSVSKRQLVEIVKGIVELPKVLILDEPTASLTEGEIEHVLNIMCTLREKGVSIIFITHKLEEVKAVSDRITVLKDGETVTTIDNHPDLELQTLVNYMVGREFKLQGKPTFLTPEDYKGREKILEAEHIVVKGHVKDASFALYKGEVLGLTGLVGAGRSELLSAIFGYMHKNSGTVKFEGKEVNIRTPLDAIRLGFGMLSEDRKEAGIYPMMPVDDNITSVRARMLANKFGILNMRKVRSLSDEYIKNLQIKTPSGKQHISNLSGGNQQKCLIARWLANEPKILFLDEPTHGIDVSVKTEIYKLIGSLTEQGVSVIFLSSELPEIISNCDRVLVMHHGELRGELFHDEATEERIMSFTLEETKPNAGTRIAG